MAENFERMVVKELARIMSEKGLTAPMLGKMAFIGERARKVVGQLLEGYQFESARDKRRTLKVSEFWLICKVLEVSPAEIIGAVSMAMKTQKDCDIELQKKHPKTKPRLVLIISNPSK